MSLLTDYQSLRDKAITTLSEIEDVDIVKLYLKENPLDEGQDITDVEYELPQVETTDKNGHFFLVGYVKSISKGWCKVFLLGEDWGDETNVHLTNLSAETLFKIHELVFNNQLK